MLNIVFTAGGFIILKWIFLKLFAPPQRANEMVTRKSPFVPWREPQSCCDFDQIGEGIGAHLLHHPSAVGLHGYLTDPELTADLFVR